MSSKDPGWRHSSNDKRIERVIAHKRGDDGIECITIYEDVPLRVHIPKSIHFRCYWLGPASSPFPNAINQS